MRVLKGVCTVHSVFTCVQGVWSVFSQVYSTSDCCNLSFIIVLLVLVCDPSLLCRWSACLVLQQFAHRRCALLLWFGLCFVCDCVVVLVCVLSKQYYSGCSCAKQ